MSPADRLREDEALDWVRRIQDPAFSDWEGHAVWLEADPRNADAFDSAAILIEDATQGLAPARPLSVDMSPVNDNAEPAPVARIAGDGGRRRWTVAGFAVAAALVGVVTIPSLMPKGARPELIRTAPGEQRSIALADGTRIAMNGDTAVMLDRSDPRAVSLEKGEAFFTVVHDAAHPFAVQAGGAVFQDVGTAFDMIRRDQETDVAVREGAVMYDPNGSAVRLDGGQAIRVAGNGATLRRVVATDVGSWRVGRLSYQDAALPEIAADLARTIGQSVTVDRAIRERHFSGVIMIDTDRARMFQRMAGVMGIAILPDGAGWRMALPSR